MKILTQAFNNYELLDSGNGLKLERFGNNTIIRPDSNCVWQTKLREKDWADASAKFLVNKWEFYKYFKEPWTITYDELKKEGLSEDIIKMQLRATISKNIGIFPEQAANWIWMSKIIASQKKQPSILNLFGYTGAATLCAAASGAKVCHVDASKSVVAWASKNQELSNLKSHSIRWIVDDCGKFLAREIKRNVKYDGLIIDPPAFGRDNKGNVFEFEKQIYNILLMCKQVLIQDPIFFIFNGYSMGYSATVLYNLLSDFYPNKNIEFGELHLRNQRPDRHLPGVDIPCSIFARFSS